MKIVHDNLVESIIIGLFLLLMVPISLSFLGWWSFAVIYLFKLYPLKAAAMPTGAIAGFGVGVFLCILYLRSWIRRFYTVDTGLAAFVFLFWSFMAIIFFKGLPAGNVLLGMVAGLYAGRRLLHESVPQEEFAGRIAPVARFTAFVTAAVTLLVSILAARYVSSGIKSIPVSLFLAVIAFLIQYFLTSFASRLGRQ